MTTTDAVTTAAALASLVVAGLGVYAYTQLGAVEDTQVEQAAPKARRRRKGRTTGGARHVGLPGSFEATLDPEPLKTQPPQKKGGKKTKREETRGEDSTDADASQDRSRDTGQPDLKKKKKKKKGGQAGDITDADAVPPAHTWQAPQDQVCADDSGAKVQPEPKKLKKKGQVGDSTDVDGSRALQDRVRALSLDTDGSWTHVDRRRLDKAAEGSDLESRSTVERAASETRGEEEPTGTHAEDITSVARVLRVQPPADETPMPGFSWEDYGDVVEESVLAHDADQEDEGEWGIVKGRNRARPTQASASASPPQAAAPPETMTKKQRQNARKRELAKAVKAEAEAARLQGLAKHKRELERLRIIEQSQQGGRKQTSGGMHATVDDQGKLVWE